MNAKNVMTNVKSVKNFLIVSNAMLGENNNLPSAPALMMKSLIRILLNILSVLNVLLNMKDVNNQKSVLQVERNLTVNAQKILLT
jgi:hypothetical protein